MAFKEVAIIIKSVDQATAVNSAIVRSFAQMGGNVSMSFKSAQAPAKSFLDTLLSVRTAALSIAGFIGGRAIVGAFNSTAVELEAVADASERLGVNAEKLSAMRYAAELNNASFGELLGIIDSVRNKVGQLVVTGESKASPYLRRLGVELVDASGQMRAIEELLPEIVGAIGRLPSSEQGIFVDKILGDRRAMLLGLDNLHAFSDEARRLGVLFTPESLARAREYGDAIDRVKQAWLGLKNQVFQELAPFLTDVLNQAAVVTASFPEILGEVWDGIVGHALRDPATKAKFDAFWSDLGDLVRVGIRDIGILAFEVGSATAGLVVGGIWDSIKREWIPGPRDFAIFAVRQVASAIEEASGLLAGRSVMGDRLAAQLGGYAGALDAAADAMAAIEQSQRRLTTGRALRESFDAGDWSGVSQAWSDLAGNVGAAGSQFLDTADSTLRLSEILKGHQIDVDATTRAYHDMQDSMRPFARADFLGGLTAGFAALEEETSNWYESGMRAANGIAGAISTNLTGSIIDAVTGAKSIGEAFEEGAARALKAIGEIILQLMVARLVAQALSGLFGAGTTGIAADGGAALELGSLGMGAGGNTGGLFTGRSFQRFNSGGFTGHVPGPAVNRDVVHAMLTPGEYVLNRAATARAGVPNLHRFNSGGEVPGAMGGGGLVVHNHITVQGGGHVNTAAIEEAATAGVLKAVQRNQTYRSALRGGLS